MVDLDVTDSVEKITKTIQSIDSQSPIDILINNAAVGLIGPAPLATDAQRRRIFDVNYFGLVNVTNAVIDVMLTRKQGRIINISSIAGFMPDPYLPEYSATKTALEVYTQATRQHLQRLPGCEILMTSVHPGPVLTAFKNVAPEGNRQTPHPDLHELGKTVAEEWFAIMEKESRPVKETVDTIFKVAHDPNPNLWNPTHACVENYYAPAFTDLSGNRFSLGLANQSSSPKAKL